MVGGWETWPPIYVEQGYADISLRQRLGKDGCAWRWPHSCL